MKVHVDLSDRAYEIEIGSANLHEIGSQVVAARKTTHVVLITDEQVLKPHAETVADSFRDAGVRVDLFTLPPGEATKSTARAERLWQQMLDSGADRKSIVVAVGGGVVGDLAGFVAATFARGVAFVQVPTTLLAQVDSSVGGKVGVNLPGAKNMVGAFWQPFAVWIDTGVLATLSDRDYRSGLAEVVKYGVILDEEFFAYLEANVSGLNQRRDDVLQHVIARSCELKAQVVSADEREESGLRAVLNYGHTFCHAFEAATSYGTYLHGEAVAIGMLCASRLAVDMGRIEEEVTVRQDKLLRALGLPTEVPDLPHDQLLNLMSRDKKAEHGKLRFVLPSRLGAVELVSDVPRDKVIRALSG